VVIDVRNTYEADIGRFTPVDGGAEYIDPKVSIFDAMR
jgi:predicted sulfurtransferase